MTVRILGISAYYHDSAAALVTDGVITAAAQEERFTRRKHDASFPANAIRACLDMAGIALDEVDHVVFYDKPLVKFERLLETYLGEAPRGFKSYVRAMPVWLKEKLYLKSLLRRELGKLAGGRFAKPLLFAEHHQSHAASAFFPSPFERAAVLCLDGVGEWATSSAWLGEGNALKPLWEIQFPHSLGLLYSAFTYYCGFKVNSGEYKLMGLAPYGEPRYVDVIYDNLIDVKPDGSFALNMDYFNYATGLTMTNARFNALFGGPPHPASETPTQREMDIARSIQVVTEEVVLKLARSLHAETGSRHLCMAGGVALNCVANGRVLREGPFEDIWIQPAAGDAGGALGAALAAWHEYLGRERTPQKPDAMRGACLGPAIDDNAVTAFLDARELPHRRFDEKELVEQVTDLLLEGAVVGWCRGPMEFGPRALGGRSILGDPRSPKMQSVMNLKIKYRESFRPFAPSVTEENVGDIFELDRPSPYMLLVANVREELRLPAAGNASGLELLKQQRSKLPAITHVDYSARVQTVRREDNPVYHALLKRFGEKSGFPVLINTSFNVRGEPIIGDHEDAYRCFMGTEMDALVIGNCLLLKSEQPATARHTDYAESFEKD